MDEREEINIEQTEVVSVEPIKNNFSDIEVDEEVEQVIPIEEHKEEYKKQEYEYKPKRQFKQDKEKDYQEVINSKVKSIKKNLEDKYEKKLNEYKKEHEIHITLLKNNINPNDEILLNSLVNKIVKEQKSNKDFNTEDYIKTLPTYYFNHSNNNFDLGITKQNNVTATNSDFNKAIMDVMKSAGVRNYKL